MIVGGNTFSFVLMALVLLGTLSLLSAAEPQNATVGELLRQAQEADSAEAAIELASQALKLEPENVSALFFRARVQAAIRHHADAAKDYDRLLELQPDEAEYYYSRGRSRFCAGQVEESIADFDKYIELRPEVKSQQWERGIALYYAGRYEAGAAQFELYQTYHDNDVENATWRYLCMARAVGVEKAQAALLPIENDTRVPMMQIYALYRGELKPAEVLQAATVGAGEGAAAATRLNNNLFYVHLYLGLYYEAAGEAKLARAHLLTAADKHKIGHYMWDVARLHAERLRGK
jgi:lipoprotein NlpI